MVKVKRRSINESGAIGAPGVRTTESALGLSALVFVFLGLMFVVGPVRAATPSPFVETAAIVRPAVVSIRCTRSVTDHGVGTGPLQDMFRRFFPDQEGQGGKFEMPSTGSGFVVDPAGFILPNDHVIAESEAVFVRFAGEHREYESEVVGTDVNTDLALLKINPGERKLPALEFGDSEAFAVGDYAIAVGNPFGTLESTLTVGVVSAKGRGDLVIGGQSPRYQDFIQTDASINFGNSGGPLVDVSGRVMGVNTAINKEGRGIGFAVPSLLVQQVYRQLRERGEVVRGYLGIKTEDVFAMVGRDGREESTPGARILSLVPGGPAAAAGLQPGDIVTEFGGHEVNSRRQLQFLVAAAKPGQPAAISVVRAGGQSALTVTPSRWREELPEEAAETHFWLGLEVAAIAEAGPRVMMLKEALGISAVDGVMVVAVEDDSPARKEGVRPGDVVISVNGRDVTDLDTYRNIRDLLRPRTDPVTLLVRTGSAENYVSVLPRPEGVEN